MSNIRLAVGKIYTNENVIPMPLVTPPPYKERAYIRPMRPPNPKPLTFKYKFKSLCPLSFSGPATAMTRDNCTNNNIQTLLTVQYYELIMFASNNTWYLMVKKSWLLLVLFGGLVGCVAPDLRLYGIGSNIGTRNANGCSLLSASVINFLHKLFRLSDRVSSLVSTRA